ncbi:MAG: undecaprenyl-diphosphate phosphatase [Oribacterium sp.]|nr:undecaprenyl-diphosphate phosphatase [Oribacterium sp.]MBQ5330700.1 undecaprenyl-diphosphate phosphatase [Oscillospiraceae bacterium]
MTITDAVIQGIIQGLTEFLPVSSSGHLSVYQHLTGISGENSALITVSLHLGTLFAVIVAFRQKVLNLLKAFFSMAADIFTGKFKWKEMSGDRRILLMIVISIFPLLLFYPFRHIFTGISEDNDIIAEGICFIYTSVLLFVGCVISKKNIKTGGTLKSAQDLEPFDALVIGIFQGVALLPGVSRSGSTIAGAQITGMKREDSIEYSFILGIPVIMAGALSEYLDAAKSGAQQLTEPVPILVGMAVAAVVGYLAIILVKWLTKTDRFIVFSVYTLILGLAVTGLGIYEHISGNFIYFMISQNM